MAAWLPGFGATLSAFPDYVGGKPALGRIEVRFLASGAAAIAALRSGEVDVEPSPGFEADLAKTLDRFADGTTLQTYYTAAEGLDVLRFSHDPARFGDQRLRRAVELAVDRQQIVDSVFAGRARVPTSYLVPPLWAAADRGPPARPDRVASRVLLT
ncbi:MAG: ABC transporter substrate-binding protein, partial [Candidatus Baltobacteraceae bacterium]